MANFPVDGRSLERIAIASDDLGRRLLRLEAASGTIGVRLHDGRLRDGDVLFADARHVVCVAVQPEEVLVLRPRSLREALTVAHALGNRHLPVQIGDDELVVRPDPAVDAVVNELGIPAALETRRLDMPFRHANAPHEHQ